VVAPTGRLVALVLALCGCAHDSVALGREALSRGDDSGAARHLEAALRSDDRDATVWRDLARAHQRGGRIEPAYLAITRAAELAPTDPSIVLVRAQLRVAREDRDGAASDARWLLGRLKDAGDLERLAIVFVRLGDADRALDAARGAVERSGGAADAYANLAVIAVELRRFEVASMALREGRARHPRHVELAQTHAALLLARGDLVGARATYVEVLPRHDRPGLVHLAIALIDHERGELASALEHARAAVEAEGAGRADVHYTLVVVLRAMGRDDEARTHLRKAMRRFSADDGLQQLAQTL
jgi:Flp pilus assembly protein TadD